MKGARPKTQIITSEMDPNDQRFVSITQLMIIL
jgi:hypothetical protein